ncbi:hypothetical protein, partial [Streptomyces lavendulae]|uniref:hypothetical protein n=1 Tax=Streptomyces lavendulae TaxID=1914 RepID=UPI0033FBA2E3
TGPTPSNGHAAPRTRTRPLGALRDRGIHPRRKGKPFNGVLTVARNTLMTDTGRIALREMGVELLETEMRYGDPFADNYGHRSRGVLRKFGIDLFHEISTKIG